GPATFELVVIEWLRTLLGLPDPTEGVLVSGGSLANITGLAVARQSVGAGVVYVSDQTHASIARGLRALGWPSDHIREIPTEENFRLGADAVAGAIASDRRLGRRPAIVVATAGTTNTGTVDPLEALA